MPWEVCCSVRGRLSSRVGTYSGVERFNAKGKHLYIERTDGDLRMERSGGGSRDVED